MLVTETTEDALSEARAHAEILGLSEQLEGRLRYLGEYAGGVKTRCQLLPDSAPLSFGFVMQRQVKGHWCFWFAGGLIFHGPHDGHGSGSSPTFAVTIEPTHGWSIHT